MTTHSAAAPRPVSSDADPIPAGADSVIAPWRRRQRWWLLMLLAGFVAFLVALVGGGAVRGALLDGIGDDAPVLLRAVIIVIPGLLAIGLTVLAVRLIERRRAAEFALGLAALRDLLVGLLAGALIITVAVGILAMFGVYSVEASGWTTAVVTAVASGFAAAFAEETLVRGVLLRVFEGRLGTLLALLLTAVLFGFMHAGNPGATVWTSVSIAIQAGLLLGACWILTQNLWLAFGVHAGWNVTQGGIFGISVSGNEEEGLLRTVAGDAPAWLSGGTFGIEGSVVATLVCLAVAIPMLVVGFRRGHVVPLRGGSRWRPR